jgi:arylsulfatase A
MHHPVDRRRNQPWDKSRRVLSGNVGLQAKAACMPTVTPIVMFLTTCWAAPTSDKPNVILIMADDLGHECLGAYGSKQYRTPNLDRLATDGVRFEQAFAAPLCTATRVMLMTGKYNHRNYTLFAQYPKGERSFGQMLREAGYATAIVDKWQLGNRPGPNELGFDEWCLFGYGGLGSLGAKERYWHPAIGANGKTVATNEKDYGPDIFLKYCQDFVRKNKTRPFFLYWAMGIPHAPYDATPDSADRSVRNDIKMYPDMVAYMDKVVGKLVATVDTLGLAEKTLTIFTGDNGTPHGITSQLNERMIAGGKGSMKDAGTHVPFLARWKGTIPPGAACRELVTLCDVYPTLAELAGADVSKERLDGVSLLPWMKGQSGPAREWVFMSFKSQNPRADGKHDVSAWVRTHRWKLYSSGRLFDLEKDPLEETPATGDEADAMKQKLQPIFAKLGATPDAMQKFRDTNVRTPGKKRKGDAN